MIKTTSQKKKQEKLSGVSLSSGIAIGKAYILETVSLTPPRQKIKKSEINQEIERFKKASTTAYQQLAKLQTKAETLPQNASEEIILLLDAHLNMVNNSRLIRDIIHRIKNEKMNAEWALEKEIDKYKKTFSAMADEYLSRRVRDIRDVGKRLMRNLMGHKFVALKSVPHGGIVLSEEVTAADTAFMDPKKIGGFVSMVGTKQSHAAIMARSLGLPAIASIPHIPKAIDADSTIIIDGNRGLVIINPTKRVLNQYQKRQNSERIRNKAILDKAHLPAQTKDGTEIQVQANLSRMEDIETIIESGAEGIGLFRSEYMFMNRDTIPSEQEQYDHIANVIRVMDGKPITFRTIDIGGDKLTPSLRKYTGNEANPALGLRGIRLSLHIETLLETQFRAILRAGVLGPIQILIPMVTDIDQIIQCKKILLKTIKKLKKEKIAAMDKAPAIGIMVETPAVAIMADAFAKECDFFSIGTNDLIQYTLAADRTNEHVEQWSQPDHPAILKLIQNTIAAAKDENIPLSLCGEMAGDSLYTEKLLKLGIHNISVNPSSIPIIKDIIRKISLT